jgi:hypothetical protein
MEIIQNPLVEASAPKASASGGTRRADAVQNYEIREPTDQGWAVEDVRVPRRIGTSAREGQGGYKLARGL